MEVSLDRQPVRTLLIDEFFDDVRKNGRTHGRHQNVVTLASGNGVFVAAIHPPTQRKYRIPHGDHLPSYVPKVARPSHGKLKARFAWKFRLSRAVDRCGHRYRDLHRACGHRPARFSVLHRVTVAARPLEVVARRVARSRPCSSCVGPGIVRAEEAALLLSFDYERELDLHHRSIQVAHFDCHLLGLHTVRAHPVPSDTS